MTEPPPFPIPDGTNPGPDAACPQAACIAPESVAARPAGAILGWDLLAQSRSTTIRWHSPLPDGPEGAAALFGGELLPFVLVLVGTATSDPVPVALRSRLWWSDEPPQPWLPFDSSRFRRGDTWALTLPVEHVVPIGNYRYTVEVEAVYPDGTVHREDFTDWAGVVGEGLDNPFGWTWIDSEIDFLLPRGAGHVLVTGWGGVRYFARNPDGSYTGPPDGGALVENADHTFTLTNPDQTQQHFNERGLLTRATDPRGRATSYLFDHRNELVERTVRN